MRTEHDGSIERRTLLLKSSKGVGTRRGASAWLRWTGLVLSFATPACMASSRTPEPVVSSATLTSADEVVTNSVEAGATNTSSAPRSSRAENLRRFIEANGKNADGFEPSRPTEKNRATIFGAWK